MLDMGDDDGMCQGSTGGQGRAAIVDTLIDYIVNQ